MAIETDLFPPRYRGAQPVGRGGMGEIYRATDTTLGRAVAIKLLAERYAQDDDIRGRFTREALAAARLSGCPNIVTIFDVGEWNGRPFIVMEYHSGGSLESRVRSTGAQHPGQVLEWLEDAARALDAAHRQGVVHRDVKPANLLLDRNEGVHVADFGIASAAGLDSMTSPGTVLGTAGYLSPEQARGERATPASDLYALGVVAFELLTGSRPFAGESLTAEAAAHVHAEIPSASARNPALPRELDPVFRRALAKEPAQRYVTAADLVAALREALSAAAGTTRRLTAVGAPGRRPRSRTPVLLVAGLLAAGLTGLAVAASLAGNDDEPATAPPPAPSTVVRTVVTTAPGTTDTVVTTVEATTTAEEDDEAEDEPVPATTETSAPATGSVSEGRRLTDQATALMRRGDYAGALPIAQRALGMLRGSGHVYEAYANYDVGRSLAELDRCDEALPYLERREELAGPHRDVTYAKRLCGAA